MSDTAFPVHHDSQVPFAITTTQRHEQPFLPLCLTVFKMAYSPIVETWALYGFGSLLIFLRSLCRWRMVGFRGFDFDDYFIWFSWASSTERPDGAPSYRGVSG